MKKIRKATLDVISIKDNKDGSCDIKIDTNDEGRRLLMQAGVIKILTDFMNAEKHKLSWWQRFKIAWRTAK